MPSVCGGAGYAEWLNYSAIIVSYVCDTWRMKDMAYLLAQIARMYPDLFNLKKEASPNRGSTTVGGPNAPTPGGKALEPSARAEEGEIMVRPLREPEDKSHPK